MLSALRSLFVSHLNVRSHGDAVVGVGQYAQVKDEQRQAKCDTTHNTHLGSHNSGLERCENPQPSRDGARSKQSEIFSVAAKGIMGSKKQSQARSQVLFSQPKPMLTKEISSPCIPPGL